MIERDPNCVIHKYLIPVTDYAEIEMRFGKILCVQSQNDHIAMWVMVDPHTKPVKRGFYVVGTGSDMPINAARYIGTVQMVGGALVLHVFSGGDWK